MTLDDLPGTKDNEIDGGASMFIHPAAAVILFPLSHGNQPPVCCCMGGKEFRSSCTIIRAGGQRQYEPIHQLRYER